jgi:hypothetical protein
VYPPIEGERPLADILDDSNLGTPIAGGSPVTCSAFILDIEAQVRTLFFDTKGGRLDGRTPGELFGFTDLDQMWDAGKFDSAVAAGAKAHLRWQGYDFDHFLKAVIDELARQDRPDPKQEVRHMSANYALAQLRWLSIWMEWWVPIIMECFAPQGTDAN